MDSRTTVTSRHNAVVVLDGKVFYDARAPYGKISFYNIKNDYWRRLPESPTSVYYRTMAVFNQRLVLVGASNDQYCQTTVVQVLDSTSGSWTTPYPNLLITRRSPVTFSHQQFLVVAGGSSAQGTYLKTVQVYNASTKQWFSTSQLPGMDCRQLTPALVNDTLYLLSRTSGNTFSISLSALVAQATSTPPAPPPSWEVVEMDSLSLSTMARICPPALPSTWPASAELSSSTFVCLHDRLLAVGGKDENGRPSSAIFLYNPKTGQKTKIGDLPALLYECVCTVLPSGELMVAGGYSENGRASCDVFIGTVE